MGPGVYRDPGKMETIAIQSRKPFPSRQPEMEPYKCVKESRVRAAIECHSVGKYGRQ